MNNLTPGQILTVLKHLPESEDIQLERAKRKLRTSYTFLKERERKRTRPSKEKVQC